MSYSIDQISLTTNSQQLHQKYNKKKLIISLKAVSKTYGKLDSNNSVTVLSNVSFDIHEGEFLAIVGPSGSGKSTLMNILGALDIPSSGQYLLDNTEVSKLNDDQLAEIRNTKIGFVFQSFNLLSRTSVERNVRLPLIYNKELPDNEREQRIKQSLTDAGLDASKWNNMTNQLSGGQMQRVAIARALVNNPSIILADEPTGNLDQKTGKIVMSTFISLFQQGKTIILITHDLNIASYASRIINIRDGQIISDQKNLNSAQGTIKDEH